jgi:hypothetical protein
MGSIFNQVRFRGKKKGKFNQGEKVREAWTSDPYEKPLTPGGAHIKNVEEEDSSTLIMDMVRKWSKK